MRSVLARWARLALTGLAVVASTSFLSGTFVFRDTIERTFDALFADGYRQMLAQTQAWAEQDMVPTDKLRDAAHRFFEFAVSDPARMQLLFQRVIPGFVPSAESFALAQQVMDSFGTVLVDAGITDPAAVDLWTALLTGLVNQQVSNDPGGDPNPVPEPTALALALGGLLGLRLTHQRRRR